MINENQEKDTFEKIKREIKKTQMETPPQRRMLVLLRPPSLVGEIRVSKWIPALACSMHPLSFAVNSALRGAGREERGSLGDQDALKTNRYGSTTMIKMKSMPLLQKTFSFKMYLLDRERERENTSSPSYRPREEGEAGRHLTTEPPQHPVNATFLMTDWAFFLFWKIALFWLVISWLQWQQKNKY